MVIPEFLGDPVVWKSAKLDVLIDVADGFLPNNLFLRLAVLDAVDLETGSSFFEDEDSASSCVATGPSLPMVADFVAQPSLVAGQHAGGSGAHCEVHQYL